MVDDYHNGSIDGFVANGRQRWGDYSQVSLDPTDPTKFWLIGEYAREYNDAAGGHAGGTGGSRWSTWISEINTAGSVPEPAAWVLTLTGFGLVGGANAGGRLQGPCPPPDGRFSVTHRGVAARWPLLRFRGRGLRRTPTVIETDRRTKLSPPFRSPP